MILKHIIDRQGTLCRVFLRRGDVSAERCLCCQVGASSSDAMYFCNDQCALFRQQSIIEGPQSVQLTCGNDKAAYPIWLDLRTCPSPKQAEHALETFMEEEREECILAFVRESQRQRNMEAKLKAEAEEDS